MELPSKKSSKNIYKELTEHSKMPLVSLCPKERSAEQVKEGLSTILSYCEHLEKTIKELQEKNDDLENRVLHLESENEELQDQIKVMEGGVFTCDCMVGGECEGPDNCANGKRIECLKEENESLKKVSDAKSDIIKNMFDFITEDLEEVQEGFTIKREWGHKYIDEWNKIVTDEFKDAVKDINENLDDMEWKTDGYEFSLDIK